MKYTIYRELNKLTKLYPFTPEHVGFIAVDRELARPSDMSSFRWDEAKDKIFDIEGNPIEKKLNIHSHNPTRIVCHWDPTRWPRDVNIPEEEAIPSKGDVSTPDTAEVNFDFFEFITCRLFCSYFTGEPNYRSLIDVGDPPSQRADNFFFIILFFVFIRQAMYFLFLASSVPDMWEYLHTGECDGSIVFIYVTRVLHIPSRTSTGCVSGTGTRCVRYEYVPGTPRGVLNYFNQFDRPIQSPVRLGAVQVRLDVVKLKKFKKSNA
jgi:hypothetical protein